jgi:multidrug efflux pump subunit AcrA (membrane-fusion protein)/opacity protein-like surface antigen
MKLKKTLIVAITILTLFLFSAALFSSADDGEVKCPKTIKVEVEKIPGQQFEEYKTFKAGVYPEITAVKSAVAGKITALKVAQGDLVSKNLEMIVINDALRKEIKDLENEIIKNKRVLRKRQGWKVRSPKAEQQAERWVKEAEAKLAEAKITAPNYTIAAPAEGRIKTLNAAVDTEVSEGHVLAEIENTGKMFAEIPVSGDDLALFSEGQQITVAFKEIKDNYTAVVTAVSGGKVLLLVENKVKEIKENYSLMFKLLKEKHENAVVVAKEHVLKDETGIYVYKAVGKIAKKADLKIAALTGEKLLVAEGLAIGDEIIVTEILSAREGTVKEQFECVHDNVKIKVMEMDAEKGKFVKRKIGEKKVVKKEVVKKEPVKKEVVKKEKPAVPAENYFMAGVGPGIVYVNQTSWADVYSKGNIGFGLKLAYVLKNKFELFGEMSYMSATGEVYDITAAGDVVPTGEESKFTNMPIYFGAKYLFKLGSKFVPFVGAAGIMNRVTEDNVIAKESMSAFGLSIMVGTYFDITDQLSLDLCMKYDRIKFTNEGVDVKSDMSGARLFLMFSYKFKK